MLEAVGHAHVLGEVGRIRQSQLTGPMVQPFETGRTRDEMDAVAAQIGVRVAVAVIQPE